MSIEEFQELKNKITFRWTAKTLRETFFWPQGIEQFDTLGDMRDSIYKNRLEIQNKFEVKAACYAYFVASQYEECFKLEIDSHSLLQKIHEQLNKSETPYDYQCQMFNETNDFLDYQCFVIFDQAKEFAQLPEALRERYLIKLAEKGQEPSISM